MLLKDMTTIQWIETIIAMVICVFIGYIITVICNMEIIIN